MPEKIKTIAITGPTATGKTALAVRLARIFDGEIISVDSRQVYRGMDIGTGKDLAEYGEIPHHLIDVADPAVDEYNLARFCQDAFAALREIHARGKLPILCGGTALYLTALLAGYRLPGKALEHTDKRERQNSGDAFSFTPPVVLEPLVLGVYYPRSEVHRRIEARLDARLDAGMIEEIRQLHEAGVSFEKLEFFGLEYREIGRYLQGECTREEMRYTLLCRIRQFAKRQDIFFRKMEREGHQIHWLREAREPNPETLVADFLAGRPLPEPVLRMSDTYYSGKH